MAANPSNCKSGDIGAVRTGTLSGVQTLAGATAVTRIRHNTGGAPVDLTTTITNATTRTFSVALGTAVDDWLPAGPLRGVWLVEVIVTFGDDSVLTFPSTNFDYLTVEEDL